MSFVKFIFLFFIFLLLVSLCYHSNAESDIQENLSSSPFDFINQLKGLQKGNKIMGTNQLKNYLQKFGYLEAHQIINTNELNSEPDDDFDETLEQAIKTYQMNHHLEPSGILDTKTVSRMTASRCGNPDIVNGNNFMQRKSKTSPKNFHTVSHYNFIEGMPKWSGRRNLLYSFEHNVSRDTKHAVRRAFNIWANASRLTFDEARGNHSDITIGFHGRSGCNHNYQFDGPGGVVAHGFRPTVGSLHFDVDESWSDRSAPDTSYSLETTALHELGHVLGLGHSNVEDSIMWPFISPGEVKIVLHDDDVEGIRALYNDL